MYTPDTTVYVCRHHMSNTYDMYLFADVVEKLATRHKLQYQEVVAGLVSEEVVGLHHVRMLQSAQELSLLCSLTVRPYSWRETRT